MPYHEPAHTDLMRIDREIRAHGYDAPRLNCLNGCGPGVGQGGTGAPGALCQNCPDRDKYSAAWMREQAALAVSGRPNRYPHGLDMAREDAAG